MASKIEYKAILIIDVIIADSVFSFLILGAKKNEKKCHFQ